MQECDLKLDNYIGVGYATQTSQPTKKHLSNLGPCLQNMPSSDIISVNKTAWKPLEI